MVAVETYAGETAMKERAQQALRCAWALAIALCVGGCHQVGHLQAGPMWSLSPETSGRDGLELNTHAAIDPESGSSGVGVDGGLRMKYSNRLRHAGVSVGLAAHPARGESGLLVRAGFNIFQFESVDDQFAFGMFSPSIAAGASFEGYTLTVGMDYIVRFSAVPNEGFVSIKLGLLTMR